MNLTSTKPSRALLVCMLMLLSAAACADTLERVRASNTFTLGFLPDFAPFSTQQGDKASGYAIDLCLKIADKVKAELGLTTLQLRFEPVEMADETAAVSAGKVDILCTPTAATLARRKTVSFSIPIYTAGVSAVVRKDAPSALLNVLNGEPAHSGPTWRATVNRGLANQTFAAPEGGVTEDWIRQKMQLIGVIAKLITVENTQAGIQAVSNGKADAFISERMLLGSYLTTNNPEGRLMLLDRIYEYAPVAMVVARGDEDFRLLVDTVLSEMYNSGEIEQAYAKYLGGASEMAKRLFKAYALP